MHAVIPHEHCTALLPWGLFSQVVEYDPVRVGHAYQFEHAPTPRTLLATSAAYEDIDKWIADVQ